MLRYPPDYTTGTKTPWRERKIAYIEHIRSSEPSKLRVSLADKLDNARSILSDYRRIGDELWSRFNAGKSDQLWYYRSLTDAFMEVGMTGSMMDELERVVGEIAAGWCSVHRPVMNPKQTERGFQCHCDQSY